MKLITIKIKGKESLANNREWLKSKGFTEAKLVYIAGEYNLTFITSKVTKEDLALMGF